MLLDGLVQGGLAEHEAANGYPQTQEPRHGRRQAADRQHTVCEESHVVRVIRNDKSRHTAGKTCFVSVMWRNNSYVEQRAGCFLIARSNLAKRQEIGLKKVYFHSSLSLVKDIPIMLIT